MTTSLTPAGPQPSRNLPYRPSEVVGVAAATPAPDGPDLTRLLQALKRFKWLVLGLALAGLGGGVVASRFIEPEYEVSATVFIETPTTSRMGPIQSEQLLESQAWVQLLRTYRVMDPVVRSRRLYLSPDRERDSTLFRGFDLTDRFLPGEYEYTADPNGRTYSIRNLKRLVTETGSVGDSVGRTVGFRWMPRPARDMYGSKIRFSVVTPREASLALSGRLRSVLQEDNFLKLYLTDTDPQKAATTMNEVIARYVDEAAAQKREKLTQLKRVLDTQVTNQAAKLKNAEETLASYQVGTVTLPREESPVAPGLGMTQGTVYSEYFRMRTELESIRRDRVAIEDLLRRARGGALTVDAFNTIQSVKGAPDLSRVLNEVSAAEAELRLLLARYTDQYKGVKDLREKLATLRDQTIPLYANALVEELKGQEGMLSGRISGAARELRQIPTRSQTEARLEREQQQAEILFKTLESSRQQAQLAEASSIPDVRILDSAVAPTQPSQSTAPRFILMGFVGGLGLGLALAILLDRMDRRLRYPEQVSQGLGLPILGMVPQIRKAGAGSAEPEEAAQVIEAFRSIRLNLTHSFDPGTPIAFAISSPSPGDGKSLIASNLALSFAESGYNTLLIDGDGRRGDLHRTFAVERRPGLLDYLAGGADIAAVLRPTSHPRLMLMPSGARRREGPELIGSGRMHELIVRLRSTFDAVIIDTPPLGAGIDPFVLATATGSLAIVLRAGETDRQLAEAKLQVLDRLPVRLLGAILNEVRVGDAAYKYYSYSYGSLSEEEPHTASLPTGAA